MRIETITAKEEVYAMRSRRTLLFSLCLFFIGVCHSQLPGQNSDKESKAGVSQKASVFAGAEAQGGTRARAEARSDTKAMAATSSESEQSLAGVLRAGMQLEALLDGEINSGKNKPGDKFIMRTAKDIKLENGLVLKKGTKLIGRVAEAQRFDKSSGSSKLVLVFDELNNKELSGALTATIVSVARAESSSALSSMQDDPFGEIDAPGMSRGEARAGAASGGLLGGVTGTAGSAIGSTVGAAGEIAGGTASRTAATVGSGVKAAGETAGDLSTAASGTVRATADRAAGTGSSAAGAIVKGASPLALAASSETAGSSVLTLQGKDLKLEKGSRFLLSLDKDVELQRREK